MPGIYIHVPFCKQACHYCDFHFSTSLKYKNDFINALLKEIELQAGYLKENAALQETGVESIYFGGGTPSILTQEDLFRIFDQIAKYHTILPQAEITLEANPDDLDLNKLKLLKQTPVNRLSIGIQSFHEEDLRWMNRAHSATQSLNAVKRSQDIGFKNLTIDLIYGFPILSDIKWEQNLKTIIDLDVPHVSSYCMTVEPRTKLADFIKKGKTTPMDEEQAARHFEMLTYHLKGQGYQHYEISNFCKEEHYSRHNSNYWKGEKYLGLGPSAHSFNGNTRQWNVANNQNYIASLNQGHLSFEKEELSANQKYNEYVLTTLRTIWGTSLDVINNNFGKDFLNHCIKEAQPHIEKDWLISENSILYLSEQGKLMADKIASDLFRD